MKLPHGNPTPGQPANRPSATPEASPTRHARPLHQLQLENRQAVVVRVAELMTERSQPQAVLEVRGQRITVELPANGPELRVGDLIRLMRDGQSLTLLDKLPATAEARLEHALLRHLPGQQSLDSGLTRLFAALTSGLKSTSGAGLPGATLPLPAPVREALLTLTRLLPAVPGSGGSPSFQSTGSAGSLPGGTLDAAAVKQWLTNSGLFAEAGLARSTTEAGPADLKLALGRLALTLLQHQNLGSEQFTLFTPMPSQELITSPLQFPAPAALPVAPAEVREPVSAGQMLRLLAGLLNRITVNQLHSQVLTARAGDGGAPVNTLITDLPWISQGGDVRTAQLRIDYERHDRQESAGSRKAAVAEWRFSLAMDLDDAGRVFFDVALRQSSVSARVWAEKQATVKRVTAHLAGLRSRLTELGLEVAELECRRGQPPATPTRLEHRLVDTRA